MNYEWHPTTWFRLMQLSIVLQFLVINSVSDKIYSLSRSNTHSVLGLLLTIRTTLNRNLGMCFETSKFDDMPVLPTIHVYLLPKVKIFQRLNFQVPNDIFSLGLNYKSFLQSCKSYVGKVTGVAYLSVKRSLLQWFRLPQEVTKHTCPGCQTIHNPHPLAVKVIDSLTPCLRCNLPRPIVAPWDSVAKHEQ